MIPAEVHSNLIEISGEYGYASWHGFAFVKIPDNGFALMCNSYTAARIWEDCIEIYTDYDKAPCSFTRKGHCEKNSPYVMRFDVRPGGKAVGVGRAFFVKLIKSNREFETTTGIRILANGEVELLTPIEAPSVNKDKAKKALALVRERLKIPFATAKLLGVSHKDNKYRWVNDELILKAIVEDNTDSLTNTSLVFPHAKMEEYKRATENFINRYRHEIYMKFECFDAAA